MKFYHFTARLTSRACKRFYCYDDSNLIYIFLACITYVHSAYFCIFKFRINFVSFIFGCTLFLYFTWLRRLNFWLNCCFSRGIQLFRRPPVPNKTIRLGYERRKKIKQGRKNRRPLRSFALCMRRDKKILPIRMQRARLQSDLYRPLTSYGFGESERYECIAKWINVCDQYHFRSFRNNHSWFLYYLWNFHEKESLSYATLSWSEVILIIQQISESTSRAFHFN